MSAFLIEFKLSGVWTAIVPADKGLVPGQIVANHLQQYYWSFRHVCAYDVQTYLFGTPVRLTYTTDAGVSSVIFRGFIAAADRTGSPRAGEGIVYRCESFWAALGQYTLKYGGIPRVVYNARPDDPQFDSGRVDMTVSQILTDIDSLSRASISAITTQLMGVTWPGFLVGTLSTVPPKTILDAATPQSAIIQLLKWSPDASIQINPDTGLVTFIHRGAGIVHNVTLDQFAPIANATPISEIKIQPRLDLVVPELKLYYPVRNEYVECYIDAATFGAGRPDYTTGMANTITQITPFQFQLSHTNVTQVIDFVGAGPYNISFVTGIVTFKYHPTDFYVRYMAETTPLPHDTGLGGTGYTDYGITFPIVERYLSDFPIETRAYNLMGVDSADATWLLTVDFAADFVNNTTWPGLVGKAVSIPGRGASTIAQVAIHTFTLTGLEALAVGALLGVATGGSPAILVVNAVAIQLVAAISGATRGDVLNVTTQDASASINALADGLWKSMRDVRWAGDLPMLKWDPSFQIGDTVNLLNTNDARMATMNESVIQYTLDPVAQKTFVRLAANPYTQLDDLLSIVRQKIPAQQQQQQNTSGGGSAPAKASTTTHDHSDTTNGGSALEPVRLTMNSGTPANNKFVYGNNGMTVQSDKVIFGNPTGARIEIDYLGVMSFIASGGKTLVFGASGTTLRMQLDTVDYFFTSSGTLYMGAKVQ